MCQCVSMCLCVSVCVHVSVCVRVSVCGGDGTVGRHEMAQYDSHAHSPKPLIEGATYQDETDVIQA